MIETKTHTVNITRTAQVFVFDLTSSVDESLIVEKILDYKEKFPAGDISNAEGWHLFKTHNNNDNIIDELNGAVREKFLSVMDKNMFEDVRIESSWPIVYNKGAGISKHSHGQADSDYAAVYYAASDPAASPLKFEGGITILPEAGMLVIFSGWLKHEVPAMRFNCTRVVVSFNLRCILKKERYVYI